MGRYAKAIVAALGGAVTAALTVWGPETKVGQVLVIAAAALTALGVYATPNQPAVTR